MFLASRQVGVLREDCLEFTNITRALVAPINRRIRNLMSRILGAFCWSALMPFPVEVPSALLRARDRSTR